MKLERRVPFSAFRGVGNFPLYSHPGLRAVRRPTRVVHWTTPRVRSTVGRTRRWLARSAARGRVTRDPPPPPMYAARRAERGPAESLYGQTPGLPCIFSRSLPGPELEALKNAIGADLEAQVTDPRRSDASVLCRIWNSPHYCIVHTRAACARWAQVSLLRVPFYQRVQRRTRGIRVQFFSGLLSSGLQNAGKDSQRERMATIHRRMLRGLCQTRTGVATQDRSSTAALAATVDSTGFAGASVEVTTADGGKVLPVLCERK